MEFYERLKQLRKEKGLTQQELGEELYVNRSVISRWENGERYPSVEDLKNIALFFRVSVDELIGNEKTKYIENSPVADENTELMGYGSLLLLTFVLLLLEVCTGKDFLVPESARWILIAEHVFLLALYGLGIRLSFQKRMNPKIIGAVLLLQFLFPGIQKVWEYYILWKEKQIEMGLWIERSVICLLLWAVPGILISRFFFRKSAAASGLKTGIVLYTGCFLFFVLTSYSSLGQVQTVRFVYEVLRCMHLLIQTALALYYVHALQKKRSGYQSS